MLDALADRASMLNYGHVINTQAGVPGHSHSDQKASESRHPAPPITGDRQLPSAI